MDTIGFEKLPKYWLQLNTLYFNIPTNLSSAHKAFTMHNFSKFNFHICSLYIFEHHSPIFYIMFFMLLKTFKAINVVCRVLWWKIIKEFNESLDE